MPKKPKIVKKQEKRTNQSIKDFQSKYGGDFKSKGERISVAINFKIS